MIRSVIRAILSALLGALCALALGVALLTLCRTQILDHVSEGFYARTSLLLGHVLCLGGRASSLAALEGALHGDYWSYDFIAPRASPGAPPLDRASAETWRGLLKDGCDTPDCQAERDRVRAEFCGRDAPGS